MLPPSPTPMIPFLLARQRNKQGAPAQPSPLENFAATFGRPLPEVMPVNQPMPLQPPAEVASLLPLPERPKPLQLPERTYNAPIAPQAPNLSRDFRGEAKKRLLASGLSALLGGLLGGGAGAASGFVGGNAGAGQSLDNQYDQRAQEAQKRYQAEQNAYEGQMQNLARQMQIDARSDAGMIRQHDDELDAYNTEVGNILRKQAADDALKVKREGVDARQLDEMAKMLRDPMIDASSKSGIVDAMNEIRARLYPDLPPIALSPLTMTPKQTADVDAKKTEAERKAKADQDKKEMGRLTRLSREKREMLGVAGNPAYGVEARKKAIRRVNEINRNTGGGMELPEDVNAMTPYQQGSLDARAEANQIRSEARGYKKGKGDIDEYLSLNGKIAALEKAKPRTKYDPLLKETTELSDDQQAQASAIEEAIQTYRGRQRFILDSKGLNPDGSPRRMNKGAAVPAGIMDLSRGSAGPLSSVLPAIPLTLPPVDVMKPRNNRGQFTKSVVPVRKPTMPLTPSPRPRPASTPIPLGDVSAVATGDLLERLAAKYRGN